MIQVVFFDLGLTLIDGSHKAFPHVPDALRTIQSFKTADGRPLLIALVSNYDKANTPADVEPLFKSFLDILDGTGLRPFFEPVQQHITLSTHAGVRKPDRKVFEKALERLGSRAPLAACLLITEEAEHGRFVRTQLGMKALLFRSEGSEPFDFADWREAPALVARAMSPSRTP
jgi:FMN phosphatase YigB (HAD superfamily)